MYANVSFDFDQITDIEPSNKHIENYDEFGTVNIDYDMPSVDMRKLINSDTPNFKLPKCTTLPVNAYDLVNREESAFPYLFPFCQNGFKQERKITLFT